MRITLSKESKTEDKFNIKFYYDGKDKPQSQELEISYHESNCMSESYPNMTVTIYGEDLKEVLKNKGTFIDDFIIKLQKLKGDIDGVTTS